MCIACELGYWAMVDAIEAERKASPALAEAGSDARFDCAPVDSAANQDRGPMPPTDEPAS